MTDNGSQTTAKRTLTVKNFSVIKEAKLEFGKITVLIGPQASGKSLLCKLAYFLGWETLRIAMDTVVNRLEFKGFQSAVQSEFAKRFPSSGWGTDSWSIQFSSDRYEVRLFAGHPQNGNTIAKIEFSRDFQSAYEDRLRETLEDEARRGFSLGIGLQSLAATRFREVAGRAIWDASTYIPVDRSYIVDTTKAIASVASDSEPIIQQFALTYRNSLAALHSGARIQKYICGHVILRDSEWMLAFADGRLLSLSHLSSGSKEILPILAVLDYYESQRRSSGNLPSAELYSDKLYQYDDFTIEEPESSVFPETQSELMREIVALSNEDKFLPRFTITTHSPYILSAFNNLLEASQVAAAKPEIMKEVAKIIPAHYWIKPGDLKAYSIRDGKLESIMDAETGLISSNYLDSVSDTIGAEFDELLRLGYVES